MEQRPSCGRECRKKVLMLRVNEIIVPPGTNENEIRKQAARQLGVSASAFTFFEIAREAIDSRKKNNIRMVYSVHVELDGDESSVAARFPQNKVSLCERYQYVMPENKRTSTLRPVVVGFGPAGMFAGLMLARAGLNPLILERGNDVDTRTADVHKFWTQRTLNTQSNVQFGEGGAGTFSDGKLTTGIKDSRVREVFEVLCQFGAPAEIAYSARPHIGTDRLGEVVKNIRKEIIRLGGEVRFGCRLTDIIVANSFIHGIRYVNESGNEIDMETDCVVLCIGHSARDTVEMLYRRGLKMEKKPFSVGVRIEHPQEMINRSQYGNEWNNPLLGAADYKLSNHPLHGRGGYTFCMCPGGTVVCASSEEEMVVVNGMSEYARDGRNANSAILIGLEPEYFEDEHPLAGMAFQREIERKAFLHGGKNYTAPAQTVGDFLKERPSQKGGAVIPTCPTGVEWTDIRKVLPPVITDQLAVSILAFDRKLKGFAMNEAVLTAPESRSSSPVRIVRDECRQASVKGIFPCGEGAGYAGGIVSAAVDGIRCAEAVFADEYWD